MNQEKKTNYSQRSSDQQNFEILSMGEDKSQSIENQPSQIQLQEIHQLSEEQRGRRSRQKKSKRNSDLEQIKESVQIQKNSQNLIIRIQELQKENETLQDKLNKAIQKCEKVNKQLKNTQQKLTLIQKQHNGAKQVINNMSKRIISLQQNLIDLEQKLSKKQSLQSSLSLNQMENHIQGLKTKIQYYQNQEIQIRQKIEQILNVKPKQKQKMSTLVESVLIDLLCNLKQIGRQLDEVIQIALKKSSKNRKIQKQSTKSVSQSYNHWIQMSKINNLKEFLHNIDQK